MKLNNTDSFANITSEMLLLKNRLIIKHRHLANTIVEFGSYSASLLTRNNFFRCENDCFTGENSPLSVSD